MATIKTKCLKDIQNYFFYMRAAKTVFISHVSYSLERKPEIIVPKSIKFS